MEIVLLGTGGADGWPNPWCSCSSCTWMRRAGEVRGQSAAMVDDQLLIDCGPEAPRAALRHGRSLAGVRHLLFTHGHPDHTGPAALTWREWIHPQLPIDVAGPAAVIAECRRWVGDDATVEWHELCAGSRLQLGGYDVRAMAASHGDDAVGPALLYDVTGSAGERLLWAADTKKLSAETLQATAGRAYDVVLLEETNGDDLTATTDHLDLRSWPETVADLRRNGAVGAQTQLLPIHLSHRNPPPPRLRQAMAGWGARVPDDGEVILAGTSTTSTSTSPVRGPRRVLVLGGARSGKSRWAESIVAAEPDVTYVATSRPRPDDDEWTARIDTHRARRPVAWQTVETVEVAAALRGATGALLVDCLTLWLGAHADEDDLAAQVDELAGAVAAATGVVVVVSNEVGSGVVPATPSGRRFRDELGALNARLAAACDEVWQVTAGIPVRLA